MTSFNPMQLMGQMNQMMPNNPFSQMMGQRQNFGNLFGNNNANPLSQFQNQAQVPSLNKEQFKSFIPNINNNMMQQLVQKARAQGISDSDIEAGINFINKLSSK